MAESLNPAARSAGRRRRPELARRCVLGLLCLAAATGPLARAQSATASGPANATAADLPPAGAAPAAPRAAGAMATGLGDPTVPAPGFGPAAPSDPKTSAAPSAGQSPEDRRLQMVFVHEGKRVAIVGGRSLHVGDKLELDGVAARVEQINDASVVLRGADTRLVLDLFDETSGVRRRAPCTTDSSRSTGCGKP